MNELRSWARTYTIGADRVPLPCFDTIEWGRWLHFNDAARNVGYAETEHYRVCKVFLGIDHNYGMRGDPVLFETLVMLPDDEYGAMERYCSWAEAQAGHERIRSMLARESMDAHALTLAALRQLLDAPAGLATSTSRNAREGRYGFKQAGHHRRQRAASHGAQPC